MLSLAMVLSCIVLYIEKAFFWCMFLKLQGNFTVDRDLGKPESKILPCARMNR